MIERKLEVVTNNGNANSRFTITPDRLTIKICKEDEHIKNAIVTLGKKAADQINEPLSLRCTIQLDHETFTLKPKHNQTVAYKFETATGNLLSVWKP